VDPAETLHVLAQDICTESRRSISQVDIQSIGQAPNINWSMRDNGAIYLGTASPPTGKLGSS
jgi:hypothetical protein